ncbi:ATP-binding cassette domain-containing protein [Leifsonia aquatica]|uniref:ABC transporter, ATP-binding protein n=2 Tax=Leifsonia aquatica TaxID=144185 RepID=U2SX48_LEIAQ|nr:ABC transporter ATP-binding protein [Leifsonia aquatica]ERK69843.1 ABC transporter, ATP-binding protein [Leifsonia aquatica ATCC 14665]MBB2965510.1 peptide/nickel transport system ATP-binding protein [Leifsonia aquatica]
MILDVRNLSVSARDGSPLVRDVSFSIGAGERVSLIGESGSGKSLTSFAVAGLLPDGLTATGSVELDGVQVVGAKERDLVPLRGRTVSFVFQEPLTALDPLMRLGQQVAEPLKRHLGLRGAALRTAVREALDEVRLPDPERIARAYPHEISGGQRQRVAIAAALACRPQLLIADEPTTALDVTVQAEVLSLLDTLIADRGMSLLFVSHDLAVVSRMTDRALVLRGGRVVEEGALQRLLDAPTDPYTVELVRSARELDAALEVP